MDLQNRLTNFAIMEGSWIVWLLVGFSMGGLAMFAQRACSLVSTWRQTRRSRRLDAPRAGGVLLSNPGLSQC